LSQNAPDGTKVTLMTTDGRIEESTSKKSPCDARTLVEKYRDLRQATEKICEPLVVEDYGIQSMPDASPTKWHLAHTSWFFETFVLERALPNYRTPNPRYAVLFNSYYNSVGQQHARPERGLLSRPTVAEVKAYRTHVDRGIEELLGSADELDQELLAVIETGVHHEHQHQELMLMDIKHAFSCNPLRPVYREIPPAAEVDVPPISWIPFESCLQWIGHDGSGFAFDNEFPRHRTYVESFQIANRLTTCSEYLSFVEDGGYERPELWLADGWHLVQAQNWKAPLYWQRDGARWKIMTLGGMHDLNPCEPVSHISYYEADAFARWKQCWLPRETAWETIATAKALPMDGNFLEKGRLRPLPPLNQVSDERPAQFFGDLWEWTCSPYAPFPGYRAVDGAIGEYNGKFMCNQMVLRGGSYGTPSSHIRTTYRNFYPPDARWPFTGIRLAKELS
jgi:ergothioneine biosynthesis protein EgtB